MKSQSSSSKDNFDPAGKLHPAVASAIILVSIAFAIGACYNREVERDTFDYMHWKFSQATYRKLNSDYDVNVYRQVRLYANNNLEPYDAYELKCNFRYDRKFNVVVESVECYTFFHKKYCQDDTKVLSKKVKLLCSDLKCIESSDFEHKRILIDKQFKEWL